MEKRVLITGAVGFIGFHLTRALLEKGDDVMGVDNINDYYSPILKKDRLRSLKKYPRFDFKKVDISHRKELAEIFNQFNPNVVVNLAAMAGVRHSIEDPYSYVDSNLVGFLNIIELCRHAGVEAFVYASSSSVYGGNQKSPFSVGDQVDSPLSLYAATKKANELIAHSYSHLYGLHTTGLRFFTVYGPWGRPDMAMYIFADKISKGEEIRVFNNGVMKRDFTYIDDIVSGIMVAITSNYQCEIFNLGSNKSIELMKMIELVEMNIGKKAKIIYEPMQPGDVPESLADIHKSSELLGYFPTTNIEDGIKKFVQWYKDTNAQKY